MHYETERFMKASYLQNMVFVEEILRQQRKEKHHALDKLNYEYKLEKIIEKQQFSQEINHLRILIGTPRYFLYFPPISSNLLH